MIVDRVESQVPQLPLEPSKVLTLTLHVSSQLSPCRGELHRHCSCREHPWLDGRKRIQRGKRCAQCCSHSSRTSYARHDLVDAWLRAGGIVALPGLLQRIPNLRHDPVDHFDGQERFVWQVVEDVSSMAEAVVFTPSILNHLALQNIFSGLSSR